MPKERVGGTTSWSDEHGARLTATCPRSPLFFSRRLVGGPQGRLCLSRLFLCQFRCSSGSVDPCNRVWLVEKIFPWIDDVSPCLWLCFFSCVAVKWAFLILVLVRVFMPWIILASFFHFEPKFTYTFLDQHLWNLSINHHILTFIPSDALILRDSWRSKSVEIDRQHLGWAKDSLVDLVDAC